MLRKIIKIDQQRCNGCGLCVNACHEGAIVLENGVAKLSREDYCDGLGDCLPACPVNAISFEYRDALAYNEQAVLNAKAKTNISLSTIARAINPTSSNKVKIPFKQWPLQIKLVNSNAAFFDQCDLLIAADCCAYAYANFNHEVMKDKVTLIGCPKLDQVDYSNKILAILNQHTIRSLTIALMDIPCCMV